MKQTIRKSLAAAFCMIVALCSYTRTAAQAQEAEQLLLNVQKLAQLRSILTDLKKGYQILMSGYTHIQHIAQGNFELNDLFLQSLWQVSPPVRTYYKVADIVKLQVALVRTGKQALIQFKGAGLMDAGSLRHLENVWQTVLHSSLQNIENLARILTARQLRMSDEERLTAIDKLWNEAQSQSLFWKQFTTDTKLLLLQLAREQHDQTTLKKIYGLPL